MKALGFLLLVVMAMFAIDTTPKNDTTQPTERTWSVDDSKSYARDTLAKWKDKQWSCLNSLWSKESAWKPTAFNNVKVMGKNAGGIPQLLGLDPDTPPTYQIDRGLDYIYYRYGTPCIAWAHFKRYGWH